MFGDWDNYRYGEEAIREGASFVPFWQPILIMGGGFAAVIWLTAMILMKLQQRNKTRLRNLA